MLSSQRIREIGRTEANPIRPDKQNHSPNPGNLRQTQRPHSAWENAAMHIHGTTHIHGPHGINAPHAPFRGQRPQANADRQCGRSGRYFAGGRGGRSGGRERRSPPGPGEQHSRPDRRRHLRNARPSSTPPSSGCSTRLGRFAAGTRKSRAAVARVRPASCPGIYSRFRINKRVARQS